MLPSGPPLSTPFATLASAACPAYDEMLIALEREFVPVERTRVADELDELARPLFAVDPAVPVERAKALAESVRLAIPEEGDDAPSWLLSRALRSGRGAAPVRAALGTELARRAGTQARPVRHGDRWLVAMRGPGVPVVVDVGPAHDPDPWGACVGSLCGHAIAFVVLSGLASAWQDGGHRRRARRAAGLRALLPLDDDLRAAVHEDLARFRDAP